MYIKAQFGLGLKLRMELKIWTVLRCIFVPNLEIVTTIGGEFWHGQAQNGVNFDFGVPFDLEGQGQSPPKTIGILTKVFYTYGPNLVILAWTGDELSRGQARDWCTHRRTHRQTDAGNDNTRRPKLASGKNGFALIRQHTIIWTYGLTRGEWRIYVSANDNFKRTLFNKDVETLIKICHWDLFLHPQS